MGPAHAVRATDFNRSQNFGGAELSIETISALGLDPSTFGSETTGQGGQRGQGGGSDMDNNSQPSRGGSGMGRDHHSEQGGARTSQTGGSSGAGSTTGTTGSGAGNSGPSGSSSGTIGNTAPKGSVGGS